MSIHIQQEEFNQLKKLVDDLSKGTVDLSAINQEITALKAAVESWGSGSNDEAILSAITIENSKTKGEVDALLAAIKVECDKLKAYVDGEFENQVTPGHKHIIADITDLQKSLDDKLDSIKLGLANGIATLNNSGKVPVEQLPYIQLPELSVSNIVGLNDLLSKKASLDANGKLPVSEVSGLSDLLSGKASLDSSGKVPVSQLPALASIDKLTTARSIAIKGGATGSALFDGTKDIVIDVSVEGNSHSHDINAINGLDDALLQKVDTSKLGAANGVAMLDSSGDLVGLKSKLELKIDANKIGFSGGVASLDETGKLPVEQLPVFTIVEKSARLEYERSISLLGGATGSTKFDGSKDVTIDVVVKDNSHSHTIDNVTGLKAELDAKVSSNKIGAANGVASLDGGGKIPASQLPSYVDDVVDIEDYASLPKTGEKGKIYLLGDNTSWRWTGLSYFDISSIGVSESTIKLAVARSISLFGGATGSVLFDGQEDVVINVVISDNSHNHKASNITDLQPKLDAKIDNTKIGASNGVAPLDANGKIPAGRLSKITFTGDISATSSIPYVVVNGELTYPNDNLVIDVSIKDNSHNHVTENITDLQKKLDEKINVDRIGVANGVAKLDDTGNLVGLKDKLDKKVDANKLGTASIKNFPVSGDATDEQVVIGSDSRLKEATTTSSGLMSIADKVKLDSIDTLNLNLSLTADDAQLLLSPIPQIKTSDEITNESLNRHALFLNQKIDILAKALGLSN